MPLTTPREIPKPKLRQVVTLSLTRILTKPNPEKETNATVFVTDAAEKEATGAVAEIQEAKVLLNRGISNGEQFREFDDELCFATIDTSVWDDVPDLIERPDPYPDSDDDQSVGDEQVPDIESHNFWGSHPEEHVQEDIEHDPLSAIEDWLPSFEPKQWIQEMKTINAIKAVKAKEWK